jgi:CDP-diacylglycerol---serine O-phosphatidyltransferase
MISKVPTVSLKRIRIPHHLVIPTLLGFGIATAFLTTEPWLTLTVVGIVYVSSIPLTIRAYYRLKRAAEARRADAAERSDTVVPLPTPFPLDEANAPSTEWRQHRP